MLVLYFQSYTMTVHVGTELDKNLDQYQIISLMLTYSHKRNFYDFSELKPCNSSLDSDQRGRLTKTTPLSPQLGWPPHPGHWFSWWADPQEWESPLSGIYTQKWRVKINTSEISQQWFLVTQFDPASYFSQFCAVWRPCTPKWCRRRTDARFLGSCCLSFSWPHWWPFGPRLNAPAADI